MVLPHEFGWARQRFGKGAGDEEKEGGDVEREKGEIRLSGKFSEGCLVGRGRIWKWVIALRANFYGHRLEPETDLLLRRDQHVVFIDCCAPVESVEVQDEGG